MTRSSLYFQREMRPSRVLSSQKEGTLPGDCAAELGQPQAQGAYLA
jgi:hypothetical protein